MNALAPLGNKIKDSLKTVNQKHGRNFKIVLIKDAHRVQNRLSQKMN